MTSADPTPTGTAPGEKPRGPRAPRTDALRNRDTLLRVARAAFATADGTVSLEGIAREAGVGIGTLYRHFPTREALVEAVYAAELDDLTGSVPTLLAQLPPDAALRTWMGRYATFVATKRGMADTFRAAVASGRIATPITRERITTAIATILARGADTGSLRADVASEDIAAMLLGIFLTTTAAPEQTGRLLDLVMDALRPRAAD